MVCRLGVWYLAGTSAASIFKAAKSSYKNTRWYITEDSNSQTHLAIDQTAYMDAWKNTIKLHVQVFLRMNTWLFETCRRQCNGIKSLMKKSVVWFLLAFLVLWWWARSWLAVSTPTLEDRVIFGQGFLLLALDKSISNCRAAVIVLVHPGYFICPVATISGERSPIRQLGRRPMGD